MDVYIFLIFINMYRYVYICMSKIRICLGEKIDEFIGNEIVIKVLLTEVEVDRCRRSHRSI